MQMQVLAEQVYTVLELSFSSHGFPWLDNIRLFFLVCHHRDNSCTCSRLPPRKNPFICICISSCDSFAILGHHLHILEVLESLHLLLRHVLLFHVLLHLCPFGCQAHQQ